MRSLSPPTDRRGGTPCMVQGERNVKMACETKVLLRAIGQLVKKAESVEAAYEAIADIANAVGIVLGAFDNSDRNNSAK